MTKASRTCSRCLVARGLGLVRAAVQVPLGQMAPTGTKGAGSRSPMAWSQLSAPGMASGQGPLISAVGPVSQAVHLPTATEEFPTPPTSPRPDAAHFQHKTGVDGRELPRAVGVPREDTPVMSSEPGWMAPPQSLHTHQPGFSHAGSPFSGVSLHLRLPPPWSLAPCSCCGLALPSGPREPPPGAHRLGWGFHGVAQEKKKKNILVF